jgi:hypothetical protein
LGLKIGGGASGAINNGGIVCEKNKKNDIVCEQKCWNCLLCEREPVARAEGGVRVCHWMRDEVMFGAEIGGSASGCDRIHQQTFFFLGISTC